MLAMPCSALQLWHCYLLGEDDLSYTRRLVDEAAAPPLVGQVVALLGTQGAELGAHFEGGV